MTIVEMSFTMIGGKWMLICPFADAPLLYVNTVEQQQQRWSRDAGVQWEAKQRSPISFSSAAVCINNENNEFSELNSFFSSANMRLLKDVAISFASGAATGAIECVVTYPTEFAKTHLQLQQHQLKQQVVVGSMFQPRAAVPQQQQCAPYKGMVDCMRRTVAEHGVMGLYNGFVPLLVGTIPKQASRWGAYEFASTEAKKIVAQRKGVEDVKEVKLGMAAISACGFFAGTVEALCAVIPTETVKTILIDDRKQPAPRYAHLSFPRALRAIWRDEGSLFCFYRGVSSTIIKQGFNQTLRFPIQFTCMNAICSDYASLPSFTRRQPVSRGRGAVTDASANEGGMNEFRRKNPLWNGVAGFIAGVLSVLATQPIDTVKTQMQSAAARSASTSGHRDSPHKSTLTCARYLYQKGGMKGLYAGVAARSVRVGIDVGLTFTVFPIVKALFSGGATNQERV